jgi:hypothetical protein
VQEAAWAASLDFTVQDSSRKGASPIPIYLPLASKDAPVVQDQITRCNADEAHALRAWLGLTRVGRPGILSVP